MNGATALDCENTISSPNSTKMMTIGRSQYFFSWRRKLTKSDKTPLLMNASTRLDQVEHGLRDRRRRDRDAAGAEVPAVQPHLVVVQLRQLGQIDEPQPSLRVAALGEADDEREPVHRLAPRLHRLEHHDDAARVTTRRIDGCDHVVGVGAWLVGGGRDRSRQRAVDGAGRAADRSQRDTAGATKR